MKILISLIFLTSAVLTSIFFTAKQVKCDQATCNYDGIQVLRNSKKEYIAALESAQDLESRRTELATQYNSLSEQDLQNLESLLPNNVDNIKLVLELESLAKKYDILIENPKIQDFTASPSTGVIGQDIRNSSGLGDGLYSLYGTSDLSFNISSNYQNIKLFLDDVEKNLRLIEISSIQIKVPEQDKNASANSIKKPLDIYEVSIKAMIYYLKN